MSLHNKVVWTEGLFLQPQHFQQQDRYFERYVENRCQAIVPYSWGFVELEIERDLLAIGKLALRRAAGVFPDGSPFRIPDDDPLPPPLDIDARVRDQVVYLAVPLRRGDWVEVDRDGGESLARQHVREWEARNAASPSGDSAVLEVSALRTRLLTAADVTPAYACVPLAHVVERRSNGQVVLEEEFMPTVLRVSAAPRLARFVDELVGLVRQRGEALGGRVAATGRGGAAEVADFLMLQALNRYEPLLTHLRESGRVHPEQLYGVLATLAGELATFTAPSKRPPAMGPYQHEHLRESFAPLIAAIRASLVAVLEQRAVPIPVEAKKFGIHVAAAPDSSLYGSAVFTLAARADMPAEELRRRFPAQLKVGTVERIRDLVNLALPGVPVHPLPTAPRAIPFHAGYVYFEFDQSHELWSQLKTSGGIALHVAGEFPGLTLELWAIRG